MTPLDAKIFECNGLHAESLIEKHLGIFAMLVARAQDHIRRRGFETAAAYAQVAAHYAQFHPTGWFASTELEQLLAEISQVVSVRTTESQVAVPTSVQTVLHVMTEVHSLGGHTRLVWRWILADPSRRHSVVLTRQDDAEVPQALTAAAETTGGSLLYLDRERGGLLARAQRLRKLASRFDHVVLHSHPWDVVPVIAFACKERFAVPVTLLNKDDHVFWIGISAADQVAQMRESGKRLCRNRRGISVSCPMLPIPLEIKTGPRQQREAKEKIGLKSDQILLLSIASSYKYSSAAGSHFLDLVMPIVQEDPRVQLLVLGPEDGGMWADAKLHTAGRIKALGRIKETEPYYRAADLYLDSFPFNSLTSVLEAGSFETPIVSYCAPGLEDEVLCTDDPALDGLIVRGYGPADYRTQIRRLNQNAPLRERIGQATREKIAAIHAGSAWNRFLEDVYEGGTQGAPRSTACHASRSTTELDVTLAQVYASAGLSRELPQMIRNHLGLFPVSERLSLWREFFDRTARDLFGFLLPDWQKTRIRLLRAKYIS